ncbi:MAG: GntR family transcriptional regulator [Alicyclobacillus herbarius]|uniref:GntR family transcriptional regulator n=1 Tax=Alicyclobacillus herbarius TaxID=122960 RepID=UPI00235513DE|nr:GntR family transcriptional regulator [Alicyclobacillus herbarius]MCL6631198.1 GntR family transcriptional regulator [Alicyclobacillus herbarius]
MRMSLDLNGEQPLYQQIRDQIVLAIATGALGDGDSLPPIRELAAEFGIHFHTVNKAYDLLRQEGFIRLSRKAGGVVHTQSSDADVAAWEQRLRLVLAEAVAKGVPPDRIQAAFQAVLNEFGWSSVVPCKAEDGAQEG